MKENYQKMFQDEYAKEIKLYKNKRSGLLILLLLLLDVTLIILAVSLFKQTFKESVLPILLVMLPINYYLFFKVKLPLTPYSLREKVEIFAGTIYYRDLISAIESKCRTTILTDHLIQKFARINSYFNVKTMTIELVEVKIHYEKYDEKLIIIYEGKEYYITGWGFYSDTSFVFYLDDEKHTNNLTQIICTLPAKTNKLVVENVLESIEQ